MKVQSVSFLNSRNNINKIDRNNVSTPVFYDNQKDIFIKNKAVQTIKSMQNPVSFMGYSVHIVDGGNHATNMNHFAQSISDGKWDLYNKEVDTNYRDPDIKQLENLEWKLKELNFEPSLSYDNYHDAAYVALPVLANVPLQNLEAQMNAVMGTHTHLTPQNIRTKKDEVIKFLKLLYEEPDRYRQYINYMDPMGQGIEKTYGVIYQINKLAKKYNTKVYIPAGHPEYASIKWMSEQRNQKPELYNYIATGVDKDNAVHNMQREIKDNGWYDFNLLTLSEADVVNVKGADGKDYIYSAYDSCIKDGARGVYNFSPVRDEDGKLLGYGYHDDKTVDYPYEEFPANWEVQNIAKFVGRPIKEVLADSETTQAFKDDVWNNRSRERYADKLFRVEDIFPQHERDYNKMDLKGDYVDSSLQLFFRTNKNGQVIFPNCDCEGSGRPSVLSMWGSCFSIFNAIKDDITIKERYNERGYYDKETLYDKHPKEVKSLLFESEELIKGKRYKEAEQVLKYAVDLEKVAGLHGYKPLEALGDFFTMQKDYLQAEDCYNSALNELAKKILDKLKIDDKQYLLTDCIDYINFVEHFNPKDWEYRDNKANYDKLNFIQKLFVNEPQKPEDLTKTEKYIQFKKVAKLFTGCGRLYEKLAQNCELRGEDYPAFACNWAAGMMQNMNDISSELIKRRADKNTYLGDFLNVD